MYRACRFFRFFAGIILSFVLSASVSPAVWAGAYKSDTGLSGGIELQEAADKSELTATAADIYLVEPRITAPYVAGVIRPEVLNEALALVNSIRRIAGLPDDVVLNDEYTSKAQHASILMDKNRQLSHAPTRPADMPQEFYDRGYAGASNSNISHAYTTSSGVSAGNNSLDKATMMYMDDSDATNIDRLGHRRWLLNPKMKQIGFGLSQNGGYSATYVIDFSRQETHDYDFIAWPAATEHPTKFFESDHAWSVSPNPDRYDKSSTAGITVKLVREKDQKTWSFSSSNAGDGYFNVNTIGYGTPFCIIFRPDGVSYGNNDVFHVEISGLKDNSGQPVSINYSTKFTETNAVPETPNVPVAGVTISRTALILKTGEIAWLSAAVAPSNASNKTVTWSTSNENIAAVDENGKVTGKSAGAATITVMTEDGHWTDSCAVTVTDTETGTMITIDLSDLGLVDGVMELNPGDLVNVRIHATPTGTRFKAEGLPEGLTLTESGRLHGRAPAGKNVIHNVTVTATAPDGTEQTAKFTVEIRDERVVVTPSESGSGGCNTVWNAVFLALLLPGIRKSKKTR